MYQRCKHIFHLNIGRLYAINSEPRVKWGQNGILWVSCFRGGENKPLAERRMTVAQTSLAVRDKRIIFGSGHKREKIRRWSYHLVASWFHHQIWPPERWLESGGHYMNSLSSSQPLRYGLLGWPPPFDLGRKCICQECASPVRMWLHRYYLKSRHVWKDNFGYGFAWHK